VQLYGAKTICSWAKPASFDFSSSNFTRQITYWAPLEMLVACCYYVRDYWNLGDLE
jgi:hypothetical protein